MEWTTTNLTVQALAGLAGAHCAAAALQDHRFGATGHSLVGLIAGALSGNFPDPGTDGRDRRRRSEPPGSPRSL